MIEIPLGDAGRAYMEDELKESAGMTAFLAKIVSKPGGIFAPLPSGTTEARAHEYKSGGLYPSTRYLRMEGQFEYVDPLTHLRWLFENLCQKPEGTFIFQDVWAKPSEIPSRRKVYDTYLVEDGAVYYYLSLRDLSFENLLELYKQPHSFQVVGFYVATDLKLTHDQEQKHEVPIGYFENLLPLTVAVYLSAYDRESWIVWESAVLSAFPDAVPKDKNGSK